MTSPVPARTIHVWLYSLAALLFLAAIGHAIVGTLLGEPVVFVNLHIGLTVLVMVAGWRAEHETSRRTRIQQAADNLEDTLKDR